MIDMSKCLMKQTYMLLTPLHAKQPVILNDNALKSSSVARVEGQLLVLRGEGEVVDVKGKFCDSGMAATFLTRKQTLGADDGFSSWQVGCTAVQT